MNKIEEREVALGTVVFCVGDDRYHADYVFPAPSRPGLVKDEGRWKLSRAVYHRTRAGRPVQRPSAQQHARYKRIGIFDSLEDCRTWVVKEVGGDRLRQAIEAGMVVIAGRGHAKIMAPPQAEDMSDDEWVAIIDAASEMIATLRRIGFEQIDG